MTEINETTAMKFVSTDGHELKLGRSYYLVDGQEVLLSDFALKLNNTVSYVVVPYYEGEAMSVSGDGGSHHEYTAPYEVEGQPIIVEKLYKKAPTEKLDKELSRLQQDIVVEARTLGMLKRTNVELQQSIDNKLKDVDYLSKKIDKLQRKLQDAQEYINLNMHDTK